MFQLEQDLEEELTKRLKEKDEAAALEICRKQEELQNLLKQKEKDYEVKAFSVPPT